MNSFRIRVGHWWRYVHLGWQLSHHAGDLPSRLRFVYLGATTLFRSRGLGGSVPVRIRLAGREYPIKLRTRTELEVLRETVLSDEYGAADNISAKTIVDLGANVGIATLRLSASHPGARIVAVEADPKMIPQLRENVEGLPVTVVHAAICATSGERTFYRTDMFAWANSLENRHNGAEAVQVPALSLEDLLARQKIETVSLLKMDIEGAEWEVFGGSMHSAVEAIIGEAHDRGTKTASSFVDTLSASMDVEVLRRSKDKVTFLATRPRRAQSQAQ